MKLEQIRKQSSDLSFAMETLTKELNYDVKSLLNQIDGRVRWAFHDEMENLETLVHEFQATFLNDVAVINLYSQHLIRYLETNIKESLKTRLSREIQSMLEVSQVSLLSKISTLLPEDQREFVEMTPHRIPLELNMLLDFNSIFNDFKADISFQFSMSPKNIYWRTKALNLRAKNFVQTFKSGKADPDPLVGINSLAIDTDATTKLAFSAIIIYSLLYICERAIWTLTAGEQQFKNQFLGFASKNLPLLEDNLADSIRQQVHRELTMILAVACGSVEAIDQLLKLDQEKLEDDIETIEEALIVSNDLIVSSNDVEEKLVNLLQSLESK